MSAFLAVATVVVAVGWIVSEIAVLWRASATPRERRTAAIASIVIALWGLTEIVLARAGVFRGTPVQQVPPVGINMLVSFLVIAVALGASPTLRTLLSNQSDIIGIHVWRLAGLLLLAHVVLGDVPSAFGLPAGIGDVLVGATALGVARIANSPQGRRRALMWNALGILDLVVAVTIGVTTSPGPTQVFHTAPTSEMLTVFPLALIPALIVPQALALHVVSVWQLLRGSSSARSVADAKLQGLTSRAA